MTSNTPTESSDAESGAGAREQSPRVGKPSTEHGETHWSQAGAHNLQRPAPQQPNELDESASSQVAASASMAEIGKIAHHDALTSVDTDRGPVLDAVYNDAVIEGHRVGDEEPVRGERDPAKSTASKTP